MGFVRCAFLFCLLTPFSFALVYPTAYPDIPHLLFGASYGCFVLFTLNATYVLPLLNLASLVRSETVDGEVGGSLCFVCFMA